MPKPESQSSFQDEWGTFTLVPNDFIRRMAELPPRAHTIFIVLRFYTNSEKQYAFPSYETLKQITGLSFETIAKAMRDLMAAGWLTRTKQYGRNSHYVLVRAAKPEDVTPSVTSPRENRGTVLGKTEEQSSGKPRNSPRKNRGQYIELGTKTEGEREHSLRYADLPSTAKKASNDQSEKPMPFDAPDFGDESAVPCMLDGTSDIWTGADAAQLRMAVGKITGAGSAALGRVARTADELSKVRNFTWETFADFAEKQGGVTVPLNFLIERFNNFASRQAKLARGVRMGVVL